MKGKAVVTHSLPVIFTSIFLVASQAGLAAEQPAAPAAPPTVLESGPQGAPPPAARCKLSSLGSPYIPVDSWIYPAVLRLYSLGYVDSVFLGLRPWTRSSVAHMLEGAGPRIEDDQGAPQADQAEEIYEALMHEISEDISGPCLNGQGGAHIESAYTVLRGMSGTPLRDSYHLGSTVINDYGRPYANGFNNYTGASGYATAGRFSLYARGEFQHAPSATGYSQPLAFALSNWPDGITNFIDPNTGLPYNQPTIPLGPINSASRGRVMEAVLSYHILSHEISFGKHDNWTSPAQGGAFGWSNNAENIYAFQVNRVEPLHIPGLSWLFGPFRYNFQVGELQGHTYIPNPLYPGVNQPNVINPGNPWVHMEKVSFKPTQDLEFGFARTVIWGGQGHEPITLHTFLKSFFSFANVSTAEKDGRTDPGARFGQFDATWRIPWMNHLLTLYTDSEVHDDIIAPSAPRRGAWRPGIYMSHVPGVPRLDLRVEGAYTDVPNSRSYKGQFMYYEAVQKQGYTNQGQIFGDWIGREDKGGQAWLTWHLSGNEWIDFNYRRQKGAKDFIAASALPSQQYGTTLDDFGGQVVKRIGKDFEINGSFTVEHYKAPIYLPGPQTVTTTNVQLTWYPNRKTSF